MPFSRDGKFLYINDITPLIELHHDRRANGNSIKPRHGRSGDWEDFPAFRGPEMDLVFDRSGADEMPREHRVLSGSRPIFVNIDDGVIFIHDHRLMVDFLPSCSGSTSITQ